MKSFISSEMRRLALTLFIITAVIALMLAFTYESTKGIIADKKNREIEISLSSAIPEATDFMLYTPTTPTSDKIQQAYVAKKGSEKIGYGVLAYADGYSSTSMLLLVATDMDRTITSVSVLETLETKGIGSEVDTPDYLDQFIGVHGSIGNDVKIITTATVSSKAVMECVQTVLDFLIEVPQ